MREMILVIMMGGIFLFGFYVMTHIDHFLNENYKGMQGKHDIKQPSGKIMTEELSTEEIMKEIAAFRESHEHMRIVIYEDTKLANAEEIEKYRNFIN